MRYVRHGMSGKCGVYLLICKANGKRYVGSSTNMGQRITQHFGKACAKYADINPFYADIVKYGRDGFIAMPLEFCSREQKIDAERKWYRRLKPEYNQIEPCTEPFKNKIVREKSRKGSTSPQGIENRLKAHRSQHCREKCRESQRKRMVACRAIRSDGTVYEFESYCAAGRWLGREDCLPSTVSHIKRAIATKGFAFGYRWEVMPSEDH